MYVHIKYVYPLVYFDRLSVKITLKTQHLRIHIIIMAEVKIRIES